MIKVQNTFWTLTFPSQPAVAGLGSKEMLLPVGQISYWWLI